jgi:hypothetical protein
MPKVVDVILRGQLKASYPVSFAMLNSPTTESTPAGDSAFYPPSGPTGATAAPAAVARIGR